ncbi:hypothetical protein G3N55_11110 [Dissulfurirhabdus thermomarina]|uniref:Uncharacterized protein n=1 Tax=Dissulfurirhabdus thermomarina TaxID=1765737 RepID=A0A6N9TVD3_DISTH|nr:hypothetical protein [Dissulfurirhabdus thermomarina]NDY43387.1 hypothetical protein [Dissulfurirhabdus thermomarina]NMX22595.1 hypothetical protein [Dissulfurirhabdus thermomarina]
MIRISHRDVFKAWKGIHGLVAEGAAEGRRDEAFRLLGMAERELARFYRNGCDVWQAAEALPDLPRLPELAPGDRSAVEAAFAVLVRDVCGACGDFHNEACRVDGVRRIFEALLVGERPDLRPKGYLRYLVDRKAISEDQAREARLIQKDLDLHIGTIALCRGFLEWRDLIRVLREMKERKLRFGDTAVDLGLLKPGQVAEAMAVQERLAATPGQILVELGYLSPEDNKAYHAEYVGARLAAESTLLSLLGVE